MKKPVRKVLKPHCPLCYGPMVKAGRAIPRRRKLKEAGIFYQTFQCQNKDCIAPKTGKAGYRTIFPVMIPVLEEYDPAITQ